MEPGLSVAELSSQQLLARCDNSGNECFMLSDVAPSLPEPHGWRTTEASGENFGEVMAAIPFNWEVEPGIPKLQRSRRSRREGRVDECSVELPARRPLASQSSSAIKLSPRFQAEMREMLEPSVGKHRPDEFLRPLASRSSSAINLSARFQAEMREMLAPSFGKHRPDEFVIGKLPSRRRLASQSMSGIRFTAKFQSEMLATSFRDYTPEEFVIGQTLPLPPRLQALNKPIALDSHEFQQCDNMFGIEEAPAPTHGGHRRNLCFSYAMERPRKEASVEDCRASCGLKCIWPFLKEKMSWRIVKRLQSHFTNKFPQNGSNKVDHSTDYSVILDFSPNHL
ncbi:unnamed protein product [Sphagnum troendelagicum]|uniref:Uncharacterized protein n=1 Tax=Sphagnum troendelagicum TaxID=128251 RepID=A0ABP0V014_9BRYO